MFKVDPENWNRAGDVKICANGSLLELKIKFTLSKNRSKNIGGIFYLCFKNIHRYA